MTRLWALRGTDEAFSFSQLDQQHTLPHSSSQQPPLFLFFYFFCFLFFVFSIFYLKNIGAHEP